MSEIVIIVVLCLVFILIILTSWILSNVLLKPRVIEYDSLIHKEIKDGRLIESLYQSWMKEDFTIKSRYGYDLSCQLINNDITNEQFKKPYGKLKIAIICHGYTRGKYSSMIYAELFLKRGITVLTYDHRNHGLSGKAFTSMGYYEKFDLQTVIDWCYEKYGTNIAIVTHGESMGAATVLSLLAIDGRVRCTIADCAYSTLSELIKYQLKTFYHLPRFPFMSLASFFIKMRGGFWIKDVAPLRGVVQSNTPILFIHGVEDLYIPPSMTKALYDAKADKKELYLADNAKHAQSCQKNRKQYENEVNHFLDKYYFTD